MGIVADMADQRADEQAVARLVDVATHGRRSVLPSGEDLVKDALRWLLFGRR
jgi:hypothetical protein